MGKWRRNKSLKRRWERNALIQKYGAVCFYCEEVFKSMKDITFDHYISISNGGLDEIENNRLAHERCNNMKGNMSPEDFKEFQQGGRVVE